MAQKVLCPNCKTLISIDDVLSKQIEESIRKEYEQKQQQREQEIVAREQAVLKAKQDLQQIINRRVEENVKLEKDKLKQDIVSQIEKEKAEELKFLTDQVLEKDRKLEESRKAELELRKQKVQLEEAKKDFEIEKMRQLDEERSKIREEAAKKASEDQQFKLQEITKQLHDALKVNEELNRKLLQGSQQTQGEIQELELEELLKQSFPQDEIVAVGKGVNGADVIERVFDKHGRCCGVIVWESKKTKNWTEGWIQKLKDDQRREKAEIAVIISAVLPKEITSLGFKDGIWVTNFSSCIGLAIALRSQLIQITTVKQSSIGKNEKMEILYNYFTGTEFKQRIESIVEAFTTMKQDLEQERRAFTKIWEKREKQITRVIDNTVGMYGDLEGMIGKTLPKIDFLELPQ